MKYKSGVIVLMVAALVGACGHGPAKRAEPAPGPRPVPSGPRCGPNEPDRPADASERLAAFKQALSRCLLTGERLRDPRAMVFVVEVGEDGRVVRSALREGSTGPELETCAEKAMQSMRFEPFCGSDVELRWRIQVQ